MTGGDRPSGKSRLVRWLGRSATVLVIVGIILRLTIRDRVPGFAVLFYALPYGVLVPLAAGITIARLRRGPRVRGVYWALGLAFLTVGWAAADWRLHHGELPRHDKTIRVLCWNTCRGYAGWERIAAELPAYDADVIVLIEAGDPTETMRGIWRRQCPGYDVSLLGGGMVCLVRGSSGDATAPRVDDKSQLRQITVSVQGQELTCLVVDANSSPFYLRRGPLETIAQHADALSDHPVLVLGDFNTPVDSALLGPLRERHQNSFEIAGDGYRPTWPVIVPVLALDQVWGNRRIRFGACHHAWSRCSDHRPVVAELTILPP
jgi:endonuclease/exonuclease/phosphatase (EEP) superfamily protein YafD